MNLISFFRSQFKKFLGSTVRKTVDRAKLIAQEVSHARQKEEMIDIPDELTGGEQHVKVRFVHCPLHLHCEIKNSNL